MRKAQSTPDFEIGDFFGRKGDGKPICPACGVRIRIRLREHVKNCLFWQVDKRKLSDYEGNPEYDQ